MEPVIKSVTKSITEPIMKPMELLLQSPLILAARLLMTKLAPQKRASRKGIAMLVLMEIVGLVIIVCAVVAGMWLFGLGVNIASPIASAGYSVLKGLKSIRGFFSFI